MSRMLSELLGVNQALLAADLQRLELASGQTSADVRLQAEILRKTQAKTKELGLDPQDSTGKELYHALLNLAKLHDGFLAKRIGLTESADVEKLLPRIRDTALAVDMPRSAWVLKHSAAKRLLKAHPPKQLMRYLGYKSIDSLLKREPVCELFAGLQLVESRSWYEKFLGQYGKLMPMDFETRPIEICVLNKAKWQKAALAYTERQRHGIMHLRDIGAVVMLPLPFKYRPGLTITLLPMVLHHINEIRLYSAFYKLHQMQGGFGGRIAASLLFDEGNHVRIAGQKIHWRVVQRHFSKGGNHPEVLEPHVEAEDLAWRKAEDVLFRLEPALHFWHETDYVAVVRDGKPISFNLLDMALNYLNGLPYEQRSFGHFQDSLWNELYMRYMGLPALESQVLKQLDYEATAELELLLTGRRG